MLQENSIRHIFLDYFVKMDIFSAKRYYDNQF